MTTHLGAFVTAFHARTSYGVLACNIIPRMYAPVGPGELGLMLASLNYSITDGRGGMCPMCTDEGPCFLCSDELEWQEYIHVQAQRTTTALCPVPSSDVLHTRNTWGPVPPYSPPAPAACWYKADGECYGFDIAGGGMEMTIEPFDHSDVDELVAYYDENDKVNPQTASGQPDEHEEITAANAYLDPEADSGPSRDDGPCDRGERQSKASPSVD